MDDTQFANGLLELWTAHDTAGSRTYIASNGGMSRVIALAVRGAVRAKRDATKTAKGTPLSADFPDRIALDNALEYWRKHKRPDICLKIEEVSDHFRRHHAEHKALSWPRTWATWYCNQINFIRAPASMQTATVIPINGTPQEWANRVRIWDGTSGDADLPPGTWSDKWGPKPGEPGCRVPDEAYGLARPKAARA